MSENVTCLTCGAKGELPMFTKDHRFQQCIDNLRDDREAAYIHIHNMLKVIGGNHSEAEVRDVFGKAAIFYALQIMDGKTERGEDDDNRRASKGNGGR